MLYFILLLITLASYPLLTKVDFLYGNEIGCDTWKYFGLNFQLNSLASNNFYYMDDRIPTLFFNYLIHAIFDLHTAFLIKYFLTLSLLYIAAFLLFRELFRKQTVIILLTLMSINPLMYGLTTIDYPALGVDVYAFFSLYFLIKGLKTNQKSFLVIASFLFLSAIISNIRAILYFFWFPLIYFLNRSAKSISFKDYFLCSLVGCVAFIVIWGLISVSLGTDFFFFTDQFLHPFLVDESSYSPGLIHRLTYSPIPHLFPLTFVLFLFTRKRNIKELPFLNPSVIFTIVLFTFLISISFNYFVETSAHWPTLLFLLLFGSFIEKINYQKIIPTVVTSIILVFVSFKVDLEIYRQLFRSYSFAFYLSLFLFWILFLLLVLKNKLVRNMLVPVIFLFVSLLRPDWQGAYSWFSQKPSVTTSQTYEDVLHATQFFKNLKPKRKPTFIEDDKTSDLLIKVRRSVSGCFPASNIVNYKTDFEWIFSHGRILVSQEESPLLSQNLSTYLVNKGFSLEKISTYQNPRKDFKFYIYRLIKN